ncbi:hypothetical protein C3B61_12110 [Cryobacterium zongtaii]|uniref:DUF4350 domain-containing protein n=1 Tax=Cryobacterium zongtaii TaxID=1259217 RepID=A0A2S3ZEH4_9MICO|nr:DUF4350 domain-containing protein [Cryobacterium zongtaii]POH64890.1 hypothetical protein C3B61_12110 [Cryobacterium zongtaii]
MSAVATASPVSSTPTIRLALRRSVFWVVAGVGALLVAVIAFILTGAGGAAGPRLGADNPAPTGGMAVVEVLRQQGVTVVPVNTLDEAGDATAAAGNATLFLSDESGYLSTDQLDRLGDLAGRTVVVDPDFRALQALAPEVGFGGVSGADSLDAECPVPAAERAETISPGGKTLGLPAGTAGYTGCFPGENDTFSVIERVTDDRTVTLVADTAVFANDEIATYGNAALALNLLGATDTLVWYLPTLADVPVTGPPSLGALTPGWVTPMLLLLVGVAVTAMVWRGRRFGPLVAENLPVVVRASETMEGRARLYARGSARLRAVDAIRIGAVARMAQAAGLPRTAPLDQVIRTVAALTARPPERVHAVLVGEVPGSDAAMMALSDAIDELERATALAARPPGAGPSPTARPSTGRMEP